MIKKRFYIDNLFPATERAKNKRIGACNGQVQAGAWTDGMNVQKIEDLRSGGAEVLIWGANCVEGQSRSIEAIAPYDAKILLNSTGEPCYLGTYGDAIVDLTKKYGTTNVTAIMAKNAVEKVDAFHAMIQGLMLDNADMNIVSRSPGFLETKPVGITDSSWNNAMTTLITNISKSLAKNGLRAVFNPGCLGGYTMLPTGSWEWSAIPRNVGVICEHLESVFAWTLWMQIPFFKWVRKIQATRPMHLLLMPYNLQYLNSTLYKNAYAILHAMLDNSDKHYFGFEAAAGMNADDACLALDETCAKRVHDEIAALGAVTKRTFDPVAGITVVFEHGKMVWESINNVTFSS